MTRADLIEHLRSMPRPEAVRYMARAKYTIREMADMLGMTYGGVWYICDTHGIRYTPDTRHLAGRPRTYDHEQVMRLLGEGLTQRQVADVVGCSAANVKSIRYRYRAR